MAPAVQASTDDSALDHHLVTGSHERLGRRKTMSRATLRGRLCYPLLLCAVAVAVALTPGALAARAAPPSQPTPQEVLDGARLLQYVGLVFPSQPPDSSPWRTAFESPRDLPRPGFVEGMWTSFLRDIVPSQQPIGFVTVSIDQYKWKCYRATPKAKCRWRSPGAISEVANARKIWLSAYNGQQYGPTGPLPERAKVLGDYAFVDSFANLQGDTRGTAVFFRRGALSVAVIVKGDKQYPPREDALSIALDLDGEIIRRSG
jgi:hypothetical protein